MEAQRRGGRPYYSSGRGPSGPPYHYHPRPPAKSSARFEPVDREKTCPLLLRVFTKVGGHHSDLEFSVRGKEPKDEVQIYTWLDATLRELTDLVKEVAPEARSRDASLSFAFVYPTKTGLFVVREGDGAATQRRGLPVREAKDAEKRWRCRCRAAQGMEMHSGATDGKRATMLFGTGGKNFLLSKCKKTR